MVMRPALTPSRRRFLQETLRAVAGVSMAGGVMALHVESASALPATHLRPPSALPEAAFLAACLRCGLCLSACPYDTLLLAPMQDAVAGTPYFIARETPCEMCDDAPCVAACPSGALAPLASINDARMGLAVLLDHETCLNAQGLRCDVCYRVCPLIDEAITLEQSHNARSGHHAIFMPVVHQDACTGCGKCEKSCVLPEAAIKVLPLDLAKGARAAHYRLGWEEKAEHGAAVEGVIDLPDRLPFGTDNLAEPFSPALKLGGPQ